MPESNNSLAQDISFMSSMRFTLQFFGTTPCVQVVLMTGNQFRNLHKSAAVGCWSLAARASSLQFGSPSRGALDKFLHSNPWWVRAECSSLATLSRFKQAQVLNLILLGRCWHV